MRKKEGGRPLSGDWNVVVTIRESGFVSACEFLEEFGRTEKTEFFNILVMRVEDVHSLLEGLRSRISEEPGVLNFLARVMPVKETFVFRTPEEFENKAKETALLWVQQLAGKGFHVRMHRRGFKGRLSSMDEERFLADILLETLEKQSTSGHITFDNPDAVLVIETIGQRAGMSLWSKEEMERYPFLHID
jgi:tRNA(Ser,Leu) C12 N-acetylase TAN1